MESDASISLPTSVSPPVYHQHTIYKHQPALLPSGSLSPRGLQHDIYAMNPLQPQRPHALSGAEVAKHNSRDSCWVIVHGNVYDVTEVRTRPSPLRYCPADLSEIIVPL